jgi:hypothetical protein
MTLWRVPLYRGCALAAGVGAPPTTISGLNILYAAMPINKRTWIMISRTKYFTTASF